jgi:hypothetical protein
MTQAKLAAELEIRPIEPGDKASLAAAVDQSSDEAIPPVPKPARASDCH